eukprot:Nk52_evm5s914 gene=Nk52_evmTU5s914
MATSPTARESNHIDLYATSSSKEQQWDQDGVFTGRISGVRRVGKEVNEVLVQISESKFSFEAGQWIDFIIPASDTACGKELIGGYSLCSCPSSFQYAPKGRGEIKLMVRKSSYPPAQWVHSDRCRVGTRVGIRAGGQYYVGCQSGLMGYRPRGECKEEGVTGIQGTHVVLIGAGIGITPLVSILMEVTFSGGKRQALDNLERPLVTLMYSFRTISCPNQEEKFLFQNEILEQARMGQVRCHLFQTGGGKEGGATEEQQREEEYSSGTGNDMITRYRHRMDKASLQEVVEKREKESLSSRHPQTDVHGGVLYFVCGPVDFSSQVVEDLESILGKGNSARNRIFHEKWW